MHSPRRGVEAGLHRPRTYNVSPPQKRMQMSRKL
jgi:hypothetical protein